MNQFNLEKKKPRIKKNKESKIRNKTVIGDQRDICIYNLQKKMKKKKQNKTKTRPLTMLGSSVLDLQYKEEKEEKEEEDRRRCSAGKHFKLSLSFPKLLLLSFFFFFCWGLLN